MSERHRTLRKRLVKERKKIIGISKWSRDKIQHVRRLVASNNYPLGITDLCLFNGELFYCLKGRALWVCVNPRGWPYTGPPESGDRPIFTPMRMSDAVTSHNGGNVRSTFADGMELNEMKMNGSKWLRMALGLMKRNRIARSSFWVTEECMGGKYNICKYRVK